MAEEIREPYNRLISNSRLISDNGKSGRSVIRKVFIYFSFLLGLGAPSFEIATRLCSTEFFDPLPTLFHIIIFYLAPVGLIISDALLNRPYSDKSNRYLRIMLSYCFVITAIYSIWFLPIIGISLIGILGLGIGFLGLAPYFLLITCLLLFKEWKNWRPKKDKAVRNSLMAATGIVLPIVLILWWNPIMIKTGSMYLLPDSDNRYFGLNILKYTVSQKELQKSCFKRNNNWLWNLAIETPNSNTLKEAYYYIYGVKPGLARSEKGLFGTRRWNFDEDLGTSNIGKKINGLSLKESTMDIISRQAENYAYYEWTMVFKNNTYLQQEARGIVQLPYYGVVSKVSLWIDGEERDAAFGTTLQVKTAYRKVVRRKRDPILVTMIGPDIIQLQCFPVPRHGEMKIRIGITSPLLQRSIVKLPYLVETNFETSTNVRHSVWIEAEKKLHQHIRDVEMASKSIKLKLMDWELKEPENYFYYKKNNDTYGSFEAGGIFHKPFIPQSNDTAPVLLIDGKKSILEKMINASVMPGRFTEIIVNQPFDYSTFERGGNLTGFLKSQKRYAGVSSIAGLSKAIEIAQTNNTNVIWIHGALPRELKNGLTLEQSFKRGLHRVKVFTIDGSGELNSLISDLAFMRYFSPIPVLGNIQKEIKQALKAASIRKNHKIQLSENQTFLGGRIESGMQLDALNLDGLTHPHRLYIFSKVMGEWLDNGEVDSNLVLMAVQNRLVTPVTGAVVLETADQYMENNLDPSIGESEIPKIPEPEFYVLLIIVLSFTTILIVKRRKVKAA